jgi:hypothetical protein
MTGVKGVIPMKNNKRVILAMVCMVLDFGFIVLGCNNGTVSVTANETTGDDHAVHFSSGMIGTWEKAGYYDENSEFVDMPLVLTLEYSAKGDTLTHPRLTPDGTDITAALIKYYGHVGISELYDMRISPGNTFSLHYNVDNDPPEIYLYAIDENSKFEDSGISLFGGYYYKK